MFNMVVVPLDSSELRRAALLYAVRFVAERAGRPLFQPGARTAPTGLHWERQQLAAMAETNAYLGSVAEKVATRVPVSTARVYGHPVDEILAMVRQFGETAS